MRGIDILAVVYLPLCAAAYLCVWRLWRNALPGGMRRRLTGAALLLFPVGALSLLFKAIAPRSVFGAIDIDILVALIGIVFVYGAYANPRRSIGFERLFGGFFCLFFGACFLVWGAWNLYGDHIAPRRTIEGVVTHTEVARYGTHYVILEGRRHPTTTDIFERLIPGMPIRAEIGSGTRRIFAVTAN